MTVALSSLRVDLGMDVAPYARAMAAKVSADKAGAASADTVSTATDRTAARLAGASSQIELYVRAQREAKTQMGQFQAQLTAANDNAVSAGKSFLDMASGAITLAGHLKFLAVAAYALSPALRAALNPALVGAISAISPAAVAAGRTIMTTLAPALVFMGQIAAPILAAVVAVKLLAEVFELGANKIAEFNAIAAGAGRAGVGTDFFQRQTAAARDLGIEVDKAADALKKLNEIGTPRLGGSALDKKLADLTGAGNFAGNSGVGALKDALTTEERWRAVGSLIAQAVGAGERLAAIDLAQTFLPPEMVDKLRASGDLLSDMNKAAAAIKPVDVVSEEMIGRAGSLTRRMAEAQAILKEQFLPAQTALVNLGLEMYGAWVRIVELFSKAVGHATDLTGWFGKIPWQVIASVLAGPFLPAQGLIAASAARAVVAPAPAESDTAMDAARKKLAGLLNNPVAVSEGMKSAVELQTRVLGDLSKVTDKAGASARATATEFDRMEMSLQRQAAGQEAEARAIGASVGEHARLRTEARLLEAAEQDIAKNGGDISAYTARIQVLADRFGAAAQSAAELQANSDIKFSGDTVFLSDVDKQIANIQRRLHGDDWKAWMNDGIAQSIRLTDQLAKMREAGTNFATTFVQGILSGKSAMESLTSAAKQLGSAMVEGGIKQIAAGNPLGFVEAGIGALVSVFAGNQEKKQQAQKAAEDARKAWAAMTDQMAVFVEKAHGAGNSFTAAVRSIMGEYESLAQAAAKAGDMAAVGRLQVATNQQIVKAALDYQASVVAHAQSLRDQLLQATVDTTTIEGQLAVFDAQRRADRLNEAKSEAADLIDFDAVTAAQRLKIQQDFAKQAADAEKQAAQQRLDAINSAARTNLDYINSLQTGSNSTSSPLDQLAAASTAYNSQLGLARSGNVDANAGFSKFADALEKASRAVYGSAGNYQATRQQIISDILNLPTTQQATDPVVLALRTAVTDIVAGMAPLAQEATLANTIKGAIDAGNASAIAQALLVSGKVPTDGMTAAQMTTALQPVAETVGYWGFDQASKLQAVFNELDTNGDAVLQKSELIRAATAGVAGATQGVAETVGYWGYDQSGKIGGVQTNTGDTASDTDRIIRAINSQGEIMAGMATNLSTNTYWTLGYVGFAYGELQAIRQNTGVAAAAATTPPGQQSLWDYLGFAQGGFVNGPGTGTSDSIHARLSNGEFVMPAAQASIFGRELEAMRAGSLIAPLTFAPANDNRALILELRELRKDVARLRADNNHMMEGQSRAAREDAKLAVSAIGQFADKLAAEQRQTRRVAATR